MLIPVIFDLAFWFCIYCIAFEPSLSDSAGNIIWFFTALSWLACITIIFGDTEKIGKAIIKKRMSHKVFYLYAKISTAAMVLTALWFGLFTFAVSKVLVSILSEGVCVSVQRGSK